jgi:hypothetical protein
MDPDRFLSCSHVLFEYLIDLALSIPEQADIEQAQISKAVVNNLAFTLERMPSKS